VREGQPLRMKRDPETAVLGLEPRRGAIFEVSDDRQSSIRKLDTKLMAPPRFGVQLDHRESPPAIQHTEADSGQLAG
jgi:hypothetical protein